MINNETDSPIDLWMRSIQSVGCYPNDHCIGYPVFSYVVQKIPIFSIQVLEIDKMPKMLRSNALRNLEKFPNLLKLGKTIGRTLPAIISNFAYKYQRYRIKFRGRER